MKLKEKTRTEQILTVMHILAWVVVIGLIAEAGIILISYGVSCVNPIAAKNLYMGLNLYELRQNSFGHYTLYVFSIAVFWGTKAFMVFLVTKILSKVNLADPFTIEVARVIERISYVLLGIAVIAILSNVHTNWLLKRAYAIQGVFSAQEYIFMAGLVFIISQIFKRGVEIQSENDLTV